TLSIDQVHRQFGHIALKGIQKLIHDSIIMGIDIDPKSTPSFCPACTQAKAKQKPISKVRLGPRSTKVREKIYSNVW
ncbi:hypothetical protein M422DRAFT_89061, partial [Sphaerobolus stellatus SS14]